MLRPILLATAAALALTSAAPALAADHDAAAVHARTLVLDSHVDVPADLGVGAHEAAVDSDGQVDLPKLERGGVDAAVLAVFVAQGPRTPEGYAQARKDADAKLTAIRAIAERHPDRAVLALKADDVEAAAEAGKRAIVVGFLNAYPFGEDVWPATRACRRSSTIRATCRTPNSTPSPPRAGSYRSSPSVPIWSG
ncbi:membrane dipeptidase [Caulobacter flavus]|nr:membrane dipeptidase [Caulobacter flavus]